MLNSILLAARRYPSVFCWPKVTPYFQVTGVRIGHEAVIDFLNLSISCGSLSGA